MARRSRKQFLDDIAKIAEALRSRIESEVSGFDADPLACQKRRKKAFNSFRYFALTYFPHYIRNPSQSELHKYLFDRFQAMVDSDKSEADAVAAPRGEAKSTIVTQLGNLWCVVTGRKRYPVIIMDSIDQAYPMLEAIKAELEFNPRLAMDFPEACGQGRIWQVGTIVTRNDVKVQVAGSGKKLRGLRHGPYRPDLATLDDIENDENVVNPVQRDKTESWIKRTVLQLGEAGGKFDVFAIGSILHYDSVLSRLLANPLWHTARFRAVIAWPKNMALWEKWEELLRNDGAPGADAYYAAHKAEMNEGAVVSWAARPIEALMKIRARDGHDTFDSEYQNDPVAGDNAPFAGAIQFWVNRLDEWLFFGACDPSLGKAGASRDPSAILVGGMNRATGILDVVEAAIKKRLPDKIIEDIIAMQRDYRCLLWVIETVQFQEFLRSELVRRSAIQRMPVPARGVTPIADKLLRIESLQPHMKNGLIRLHATQTTLISQLRHFPKADHDDGPDALHMLWMAATSMFASSDGLQVVSRHGRSIQRYGRDSDDDDDDDFSRRMF